MCGYNMKYVYDFELDKVYDGDTIYGWIHSDAGFNVEIKHYKKLRLFGIQAPEIKTKNLVEKAAGLVSKDWLVKRLAGQTITIHSKKDKTGKYGRVLAEIYVGDDHIQTEMLDKGLAKVYE